MKIAIDILGSDVGIEPLIDGIISFKKEFKNVDLLVYGDEKKLERIKNIATIVNVIGEVKMTDSVLSAIRNPNTSMYQAINSCKENIADAVVSCGSTATYLTLASLLIKNIENVDRPALLSPFPTKTKDRFFVGLDIGANPEISANNLLEFAKMGSIFATNILKIEKPIIGLLNNGSEETKGTKTVREGYTLLKESNLNFYGNIEGRDILNNIVDVVVADGYSGNVMLKTLEGALVVVREKLKEIFMHSVKTKLGYLLIKKRLKTVFKQLDHKVFGGAIFIGLNKVVVKAHGNSDSYSFYNALRFTKQMIETKIIDQIKEEFVK